MSSSQPQGNANRIILYLNDALSIENAAVRRLNLRINEVTLPDVKSKLEHHLQETKEQQNRLRQLITSQGGAPTDDTADLSTPIPPDSLIKPMMDSITPEEKELKRAKEDLILENAEATGYKMLIHLSQKMGIDGNSLLPLEQSLKEEESMAQWLGTNTTTMINQLWPKIEASMAGKLGTTTEA